MNLMELISNNPDLNNELGCELNFLKELIDKLSFHGQQTARKMRELEQVVTENNHRIRVMEEKMTRLKGKV